MIVLVFLFVFDFLFLECATFIESVPSRCFVFFLSWLRRLKQFLLNCFVVRVFCLYRCVCLRVYVFYPPPLSLNVHFPFFLYLFKRKVSFKLLPALSSFFLFFPLVRLVWHNRLKWTNRLTWRLESFTMQYRENLKPITIFHCRQKW